MRKVFMVVTGLLIFCAGITVGNMLDLPQTANAGWKWESGQLLKASSGVYKVKWKDKTVSVWHDGGSFLRPIPVTFIRQVKSDGSVSLYGLDGPN